MLLWCHYLNNFIFRCHLLQTTQLKSTLEGKQKDFSKIQFFSSTWLNDKSKNVSLELLRK